MDKNTHEEIAQIIDEVEQHFGISCESRLGRAGPAAEIAGSRKLSSGYMGVDGVKVVVTYDEGIKKVEASAGRLKDGALVWSIRGVCRPEEVDGEATVPGMVAAAFTEIVETGRGLQQAGQQALSKLEE